MRQPPPPHRRGEPKTPGSGRRRGSLNRKTVELRTLMAALAGDAGYQHRFRQAFIRRRLHPSTEMRVWEYVVGKPTEQIEVSAKASMDARFAEERELYFKLSPEQLEELIAESQALVDKAEAMAQANMKRLLPVSTTSPLAPADGPASRGEPAEGPDGAEVDDA